MTVLFDLDEGVATLTLHRPEARNAFNRDIARELPLALQRCDSDDDIRAVVLTGTPPAFCAGADLAPAGETFGRPEDPAFSAAALPVPIWKVRKPVIAAVNGHAVGVGFTLTLQCDIRIMAADAKYGIIQARRGIMGDAYSHWTLPRLIGMAGAAEILLTGRTFNGEEMRALGVCHHVLPNEEVLSAAREMARDIARNTAPLSVAYSKRLLWDTWDLTWDEVEARETADHHKLMGQPDAIEGVVAFLERRAPDWTGRVSTDFRE